MPGTSRKRKSVKRKSTKRRSTKKKSSFGGSSAASGSHLAFGAFAGFQFNPRTSSFGALNVPGSMKPVSSYRQTDNPLLIMPFGPGGRWLENGPEGAASSGAMFGRRRRKSVKAPRRTRFGDNSLAGRRVNPSGYLSTWYGQPRIPPASWNPLLLQGHNTFREGINSPMLSNVVAPSGQYANSFGRFHPVAPRQMPKTHSGFGKSKVGRAVNRKKTNSKGWAKTAKKLDRSSLPKRCFLGRGMKFPVCNEDEKLDCRGILAAVQRSRKGTKIHKRAKALGKRHGCAWA